MLSPRSPLGRALLALGLIALLGCVFHSDGAFFRWSTHRGTLREIAVHGLLSCGMTAVIVSGGIDLSVGSALALGAVLFSTLTLSLGWGSGAALLATLLAGLLIGLVNGGLVARLRVQPFVVTLATMVFLRGLAKQLSGGKKVTADGGKLPALFDLLDARVLDDAVPVVALVFLACAALVHLMLARTRWGRHLYAVGDGERAARLAGVQVGRVRLGAYALCGALAALAGVCQAAQETHGDPETGAGYELDAIAMVVLGGTALSGGQGGIPLTVVGALQLGYLQKILSLNAFRLETRLMFTGVILVCAVLLQRRKAAG